MAFETYWNAVKSLSPHRGALYILSKIISGLGLGILVSLLLTNSNILAVGIIITILGIILMIPAELKIIKFRKNRNPH